MSQGGLDGKEARSKGEDLEHRLVHCGGVGSGSQHLPPVEAGRIQILHPFQSAPARLR